MNFVGAAEFCDADGGFGDAEGVGEEVGGGLEAAVMGACTFFAEAEEVFASGGESPNKGTGAGMDAADTTLHVVDKFELLEFVEISGGGAKSDRFSGSVCDMEAANLVGGEVAVCLDGLENL